MAKKPRPQHEREEAIRTSALEMARDLLDEAIAVLEGPLDDASKLREKLETAARDALGNQDVQIAFATADRRHAHLESLVAQIRDARDRATEGGN
jgi:hypothetical protein